MKPTLENLDTSTQLINIVPNIAEILENHNGWDRSRRLDNLIAIVKAIGYIIYNQQPEETQAKPENGASAEPERNYQKAIEELEEIFGAYEIKFPGKAKIDRAEIDRAEIIAFGDAHANPMQVIYQMLHTRTGYMPPDKLRKLAEIYERIDRATSNHVSPDKKEKLEKKGIFRIPVSVDGNDISEACKLIDEYFEYTGGSKTVVHLGDLFSDRGPCDHLILALLKKIKARAGEKFVILASNHGPFLEDLGYKNLNYYDQTRSARVSLKFDPDYIPKLGDFLVKNTQLFYFDKGTNTFFTHCPITREDLGKFVDQANKVIADPTKYGLDPSQFNFGPLEIPQNDDPEKISQFVERANQYYTAVISWFFEGCRNFEDFDSKRGLLPVKSLTAVVGTDIRFSYYINGNLGKPVTKPFNVTMVHGHDDIGSYSEVCDVYDLNSEAGKRPAYQDVGYSLHKTSRSIYEKLYIFLK